MTIQERSRKAVISVLEMAEMLHLSKSRFYFLMQSGIFPKPIRNGSCKRPVFDLETQQKCLEVRRSGIGADGRPVLFYARRNAKDKKRATAQQPSNPLTGECLEGLRSLGLTCTVEQIERAVTELYPQGFEPTDLAEVIRAIFLHLRNKENPQ